MTKKNSPGPTKRAPGKRAAKAAPYQPAGDGPVKLLSGGNPQIAKGDGDAPVQAYIAAMPEWKRAIGEWLDGVVVRTVPNVKKAVKWNSPFYGTPENDWFLCFHVFAKYVRITWFKGTLLKPMPTGTSKVPNVRYFDIHENDPLDEQRIASWVKQAASMPGWSGH